MSDAILSVVVPTYGREESLVRALQALHRQDVDGLEMVVVDQNPPGSLGQSVQRALQPCVVVHVDEPNVSTARNAGFARSRGRYVLFMDDDLIPDGAFCASALEIMRRHSGIGCLCPVIVTEKGLDAALAAAARHRTCAHPDDSALWRISETISAVMLFEREFFRRTGGFDELLFRFARAAEDQELCLRMQARNLPMWLHAELTIYHDDHVPGGCELRTGTYWQMRRRCIQSWTLRARVHNKRPGSLSSLDLFRLSRSAFLNTGLITRAIGSPLRNLSLLAEAIDESRRFVLPHLPHYPSVETVDHLARHLRGDTVAAG